MSNVDVRAHLEEINGVLVDSFSQLNSILETVPGIRAVPLGDPAIEAFARAFEKIRFVTIKVQHMDDDHYYEVGFYDNGRWQKLAVGDL